MCRCYANSWSLGKELAGVLTVPLTAMRHSQCTLLPSTRPGTRFTDGWAGGLEVLFHTEISLLPWDLNQCPLGYEHHTHTHTHSLTHSHTTLTHTLTHTGDVNQSLLYTMYMYLQSCSTDDPRRSNSCPLSRTCSI